MKAAIYHRPEKDATSEQMDKQLHELAEYCKSRNFEIFQYYKEMGEGDGRQRPVFTQLMKDANRKKFDIVLVWSFRNFRRFSGVKDIKYILHLKELGIRFISYQETFFDTSSNYSEVLSPILEWLSNEETKTISERTKAGIEKAKKQGITIGRPKTQVDMQKMLEMKKQGKSLREISGAVGVSKETARRILNNNADQKEGKNA